MSEQCGCRGKATSLSGKQKWEEAEGLADRRGGCDTVVWCLLSVFIRSLFLRGVVWQGPWLHPEGWQCWDVQGAAGVAANSQGCLATWEVVMATKML